ncbi:MAG: hypothetical protein PHC80_08235 [Eubacteriales bacterium]|nr:hypothetical protein [Eubacteriales bacterium]
MKQDEKSKENPLEEAAPQVALKDALLEERDTDKVNGGILPFPMPSHPPEEPV